MEHGQGSATLDVELQIGGAPVRLAHLRELSAQLHRTLAAVANHLADNAILGIDFEIVQVGVGSLSLVIRAIAEAGATVRPEVVISTFADDLIHIREQAYRADLTTGLTRQYRNLVTCLASAGAVVAYGHGAQHVVVDAGFRQGFEAALKERVAENTSVVGYLDAVNAHKPPYTFYLYPKLEELERIECRFPIELLGKVAALLKQTVRVEGTGHFAPVGIYPLRVEVEREPRPLTWDPAVLRSFVGKLALVPEGMRVDAYLQRNREAAGFAD